MRTLADTLLAQRRTAELTAAVVARAGAWLAAHDALATRRAGEEHTAQVGACIRADEQLAAAVRAHQAAGGR